MRHKGGDITKYICEKSGINKKSKCTLVSSNTWKKLKNSKVSKNVTTKHQQVYIYFSL